jgi:5-methylcytosine-specific restriction endonuclease McrA
LRPDCRDCSTARDKAYYQANRDQMLAYQREHQPQRNAWQIEYKQAYYQTERGRATIQRANRKWASTAVGREWLRQAQQRRRARKANAEADFTAADWDVCLRFFAHSCAYCGSAGKMAQEHVVPVSRGGGYVPSNILPACLSCNSRKHAKTLADWFPRQRFFSEERMVMILEYLAAVS